MALHELAVNAAKHGALAAPEGRVELVWRGEGADLILTWREHGGPPVVAPPARGFGSRLLEQGIARDLNGHAEMDFQPAGLRYILRMPLSNRVSLG
jgi:two-component sensor histidine kinase